MNKRQVESLKAQFDLFDSGRTGFVDVKELLRGCSSLKLNSFLAHALRNREESQPTEEELIDFPKLVERLDLALKEYSDAYTMDAMFQILDKDADNLITLQDLMRMSGELGMAVTEQELEGMLEKMGEGSSISKKESLDILQRFK